MRIITNVVGVLIWGACGEPEPEPVLGLDTSPTADTGMAPVPNTPPTLTIENLITDEDVPVTVMMNAQDPDGDALTYVVEAEPALGQVTFEGDEMTYVPTLNASGNDVFTVVASDGQAESPSAVVEVFVRPINDVPVVGPQGPFEVVRGLPITGVLRGSDADGQSITFTQTSTPSGGTLDLLATGEFTFTANPNFAGQETFMVTASDGTVSSPPATVTFELTEQPPVVTSNGLFAMQEDGTLAGTVTATDPNNDPVTFGIAALPANGELTLTAATGDFTYTPDLDFSGNDTFEVQGEDGVFTSAPTALTILVLPVDDPPRITPASLTVLSGQAGSVALVAVDPEGAGVTLSIVEGPQSGNATLLGTVLNYMSETGFSGADSVRISASDGTLSSEATIAITVL
ncbi:MAG: Ig-like domain-containing protein [Myxococcota bacterium]